MTCVQTNNTVSRPEMDMDDAFDASTGASDDTHATSNDETSMPTAPVSSSGTRPKRSTYVMVAHVAMTFTAPVTAVAASGLIPTALKMMVE